MIDLQAIQERLEWAITQDEFPFYPGVSEYTVSTDIAALIDEVKRLRSALDELVDVTNVGLNDYCDEIVQIGVDEEWEYAAEGVPNLAAYLKERPSPPGKP